MCVGRLCLLLVEGKSAALSMEMCKKKGGRCVRKF